MIRKLTVFALLFIELGFATSVLAEPKQSFAVNEAIVDAAQLENSEDEVDDGDTAEADPGEIARYAGSTVEVEGFESGVLEYYNSRCRRRRVCNRYGVCRTVVVCR